MSTLGVNVRILSRARKTLATTAVASLVIGSTWLPGTPASAFVPGNIGPVDPVAAALGFGVMTEGNANVLSDENEGTMAVGGDLSFGNYQLANNSAGSFIVPGDSQPTALVVGGRVNFAGSVPGTRLQVLSNGYAKIGNLTGTFVRDLDNNSASVNTRILPINDYDAHPRVELVTQQPVPSVGPTSPINFAAAYNTFRENSSGLATCDNTVVLRNPNGDVLPRPIPPVSNAVISLAPGVTNVLNLSAADLANIAILTFATPPTAATPLLINVDTTGVGNVFAWTAPNFAGVGGQDARFIMINFPTATALTLSTSAATVEGSIYAPNADLVDLSPTNTEGSIITKTFDHRGGEVHYFPFSTTLSCGSTSPASISVVKSSTTPAIVSIGQQVPYSFLVVNTGGTVLSNVNITDVQVPPSSDVNLSPIVCPLTTLNPAESTTCTATYTVTQADLDNDGVTDVATAHGTPPTGPVVDSPPNSLTIPAGGLVAEIGVVKTSTTTTISTVGQVVPYTFSVANTGNLTLSSVNVTDVQTPPSLNANLGPIVCAQTILAPGTNTICTANYTVTQADLDNDGVTDTATAHGTPPFGPILDSPPNVLTIPAAPLTTSIAVLKSSTTAAIVTVGQVVPYSFHVTNNGGRTLTNVNVTDVQTPPSSNANLGPITCAQTTLAPGASTTCTANYTVTQADLNNGGVTDVATAHGTPPTGPAIDSPPNSLTIPSDVPAAEISVVKSSPTALITAVGQQVTYSFLVVNTGGVTLTAVNLTDLQIAPSLNADLGPITCLVTTLDPAESTTCTAIYTVTPADLANEAVSDVATAHGTPPVGLPINSAPSNLTIPAEALIAEITVVKESTTVAITIPGQLVPYSFMVLNSGQMTLNNVNVTDVQTPPSLNANLGPITCPVPTLTPGQSTICTATYTVTQADLDNGGVTNTATAHGTPPTGPVVHSPPNALTIPETGLIAEISVVKASSTLAILSAGQQVPYTFFVVNSGGLTLTDVWVIDTLIPPADVANLGPITCGDNNLPNGTVTLSPGAAITCQATYTVSQADFDGDVVENIATATGTPPYGPTPTSPHSQEIIPVPHPSIAIAKSVDPASVARAGDVVTYNFVVVNTGNTTLSQVRVDETTFSGTAPLGTVTCGTPPVDNGQVFLPVDGSVTCVATYSVTQADIDAGAVNNTAIALGTPTIPGQPDPAPITSAPSSAQFVAAPVASIAVVKSSTTTVIRKPHEEVPYSFLVTNTGDVTLTNVTVSDVLTSPASGLGPITCGNGVVNGHITFAPGATITCAARYSVSKADYDHGSLRDVATATGTPPSGTAVTAESVLTIPVRGHHPLPITGNSNVLTWVAAGVTTLLVGLGLVLLARRHRARWMSMD